METEALRKYKNGVSFKQYIYILQMPRAYICLLVTNNGHSREEKKWRGGYIFNVCLFVIYLFIVGRTRVCRQGGMHKAEEERREQSK